MMRLLLIAAGLGVVLLSSGCAETAASAPSAAQRSAATGYVMGLAEVSTDNELLIQGRMFRLEGITLPGVGETCTFEGHRIDKGVETRRALQRMLRGRQVTCHAVGTRFRGVHPAVCDTIQGEVNLGLIARGYARPAPSHAHGTSYRLAERRASAAGMGLHACR